MLCRVSVLCCFLFTVANAVKTPVEEDYYWAAVVEYSALKGEKPDETFTLNSDEYVKHIQKAASTADIIVFPEATLLPHDNTIFVKVPSPGENVAPATSDDYHPVLKKLSKAALDNEVYVLINLHEEAKENDTTLRYNTNVVFNRNGTVVARYRKFHLFAEQFLNTTKVPEVSSFVADFGVLFGTLTCFDILFEEPGATLIATGVTDVLYPTYWFSELPFLTASEAQAGWAYSQNVNLLAAGGNFVPSGTSGSGIYRGAEGPIVSYVSRMNDTRILSAKIYKKDKTGTSEDHSDPPAPILGRTLDLNLLTEKVDVYKTERLLPTFNESEYTRINITDDPNQYELTRNYTLRNYTISQCKFTCTFDIDVNITYRPKEFINLNDTSYKQQDSFHHFQYRLAVFDGVRRFDPANTGGQQLCAIIPCLSSNISSCGKTLNNVTFNDLTLEKNDTLALYRTTFSNIVIRSKTFKDGNLIFPDILESSDNVYEFGNVTGFSRINFDKNDNKLEFSSDRLVTAGIFSRVFDRDGSKPGPAACPSDASTLHASVLIIISSILIISKIFY